MNCDLGFFLVLEKRDLNSRTVRKIAASARILIASRELTKESPYKSQEKDQPGSCFLKPLSHTQSRQIHNKHKHLSVLDTAYS